MEQLVELSQLSLELYAVLYRELICRFVEFVQVLPTHNDSPLCGLMNEGLIRGMNVLHQFITQYSRATPLERYAVFSAALLRDIARVVVNQKIFVTDTEGNFIKEWQPFAGALTKDKEAESYRMMPLSSTYQRMTHSITPILARQLLPQEGFAWITSDATIFVDWLDALRDEDSEGTGRIANTLQHYMSLLEGGGMESLPDIPISLEGSSATQYADSFLAWLQKGLANGEIAVNTPHAGVHVTKEGVFLEKPGIFKQYIDLHVNVPVNMFTVYQQFGNLFGLTKLSGIDYRIDQLFSEYPEFAQHRSKGGFASLLSSKTNSIRDGVMIHPSLIYIYGEPPSPTPYMKALPASQRPQNLPPVVRKNVAPENKLK